MTTLRVGLGAEHDLLNSMQAENVALYVDMHRQQ